MTQQQTETEGYNGWSNYETWAVNLWITNEQSTSEYWDYQARHAWVDASLNVPEYSSQSLEARVMLADALKDAHEETAESVFPEPLKASVWTDLLNAALSEVDWLEIADSLLSGADLEGYDPR